MGTPEDHLPPPLSDESVQALMTSLDLPPPTTIISPRVLAAYHSIYILTFSADSLDILPNKSGWKCSTDLILRVSGPHLPRIKTENEVAIISWILKNTTVPVPAVVKYDASCDNPIGHEYILLERASGESLDVIFKTLDEDKISSIIDQLVDVLVQLHSKEWDHIGGLKFTETGEIVPGPVLEETFWQVPDIQQYWGPDETVETLNIKGPFPSYVDYISAHIRKYKYAIATHESLTFMRDLLPRLDAFLGALARDSSELNKVKLKLAHKDLHFGNILYDTHLGEITAIIDWEFAGIVPFTRWNPTRAFMWNGGKSAKDKREMENMLDVYYKRCAERGITIPQDAEFSSFKQENMQKASNFLRAIVEVSPRGQRKELVGEWRDELLQHISAFEA